MADDYCNQCGMNENHCHCPTVRPGWLDRQIQDALCNQPHVMKAEIADLRAQLAARDAEVVRLTHDIERHIAIASQEADVRIKAEAEVRRLRAWVEDMGHRRWCRSRWERTACDCGYPEPVGAALQGEG